MQMCYAAFILAIDPKKSIKNVATNSLFLEFVFDIETLKL